MRILCVAEKPSQAKAVVQILGQGRAVLRNGCSVYNKNFDFQYRVSGTFVSATMTSVMGHVTKIDFPLAMRRWSSCNPATLFTAPIVQDVEEKAKDIAKNIEREARSATHLYIWTDCDREGEGIGYEIAEISKSVNARIIVKRAHFSSVLPQEIHNAMQNPRDLDMRLVNAVQARTELDLRIGSALTRFQTLRLQSRFAAVQDRVVSYGPCQFPTLGFVVDQFLRVESFVPESFWYIFLEHEKSDGKANFSWRRQRLFDQETCFALYFLCMQTPIAHVRSVRSRPKEKWRPLPLTTVELQKCCSRFLRLAPDAILSVAEGLYNQGFVSYPRTETDQFDRNMDLKDNVAKLTQYQPLSDYAQRLVDGEFRWPRQGRNNDKAHPPIHPVAPANNLTGDAKRVYEFITRRFLACCSDNAKGQATEVDVEVAGEQFHTKGLMIVARNYLDIYPYERWAESTVPVYTQGDTFEPTTLEMRSGTTTAPKLLMDSDLIDAMEKNGIGTDATHADHIKKIIEREYVFKSREGYYSPSTLGVGLVEGYDAIGLELSLTKPYLRRETERQLKRICDGLKSKEDVIRESVELYSAVYAKSVEQVERLEQALSRCLDEQPLNNGNGGWTPTSATPGGEEVCRCPTCRNGSLNLRSKASGGWMIGCSLYPQCKRAIWIPASVTSISVSSEICALCQTPSTGPVKLLEMCFRRGAAPPGLPTPYRGCVLGFGRNHHRRQRRSRFDANNNLGPSSNPLCDCNIPSARRVVAKEGANKGRPFFACTKPQVSRCDFFKWGDEQNAPNGVSGNNRMQSYRGPSPSLNNSFGSFSNEPPTSKPQCKCGLYAALKTKHSAGENQGREYYLCTREYMGCGFVCWKDEAEAYISGSMSRAAPTAATSSECYKCGVVGHWSRDCPNAEASGSNSRTSSTRSRRGRGRGRGAALARPRASGPGGGSSSNGDFADPDPDFEFWS
ncbi:DNA topoisomerase 3-alpha [Coemansia reversa NRRL 1564]|uniref:DNA topoisomerase n=1 Tax=Coemansia reversa (strain ATCC 12441 / NRRL 1564) TaxID=763665 RepID=A0A2G5B3Y2_COERN|nr:DNA topoisomerase 3-alpha [Coemansia reversa NRRL 1564]|eukprot:PIA13720.1 DNA topoisomerase 3-alpha [Coemansia reversa NRRL 1564]